MPSPQPTPRAAALLAWYDRNARDLPWRVRGGAAADPYRVWLSEIMLQQTTVKAVAGYYTRFLARWPDIGALAAAPEEEVLGAWAGLGYYARARNLHACAKAVVAQGGRFPESEEGLRALPGIGPYTAAAIAAIAFGAPAAAIDGNVERVIARAFAIRTPLPGAKPAIRRAAAALVPAGRPGDFAQGLMDLGATICTPRAPSCGRCPWAKACRARAQGIAEDLPVKRAKPASPQRYGAAFVAEDTAGRLLVRRRPRHGLLGGMLEVPTTPWTDQPPPGHPAGAPLPARWRLCPGRVRHTFTHFRLELAVWHAGAVRGEMAGGHWHAVGELEAAALPTLMRKVIAHALARGPG